MQADVALCGTTPVHSATSWHDRMTSGWAEPVVLG